MRGIDREGCKLELFKTDQLRFCVSTHLVSFLFWIGSFFVLAVGILKWSS